MGSLAARHVPTGQCTTWISMENNGQKHKITKMRQKWDEPIKSRQWLWTKSNCYGWRDETRQQLGKIGGPLSPIWTNFGASSSLERGALCRDQKFCKSKCLCWEHSNIKTGSRLNQ